MRRLSLAAAVAGAILLAGCGQSSAGRPPLGNALSYFPARTPVVAAFKTATRGTSAAQLKTLQSDSPSSTLLRAGAFQELARFGVDYNRDVKPLYGNPIVLGIGSSRVGPGQTTFLAAWQTRSAAALGRLVRSIHGLSRAGAHDGATLYAARGFAVAVDGPLVLLARNTVQLDAALDRHAAGDGFSAADYADDTAGLPGDGFLTVVGDLATALSSPRSAQARRVPWVAALRGYGLTLTAASHQLGMDFRVQTDGRTLTDAQLPFASGASSPDTAGILPVALGLRDPAQVYAFAKDALRVAAPARYRTLERRLRSARRRSGVDVDRLIGSFTGDLQLTSDGHTTILCTPVPAGEAPTLTQALAHPTGGDQSTPLGGGLYRIRDPDGSTVVVGIVNGQLVGGRASAAEVRAYATAPSTPVSGAHGAIALRIAVGQLLQLSGHGQANPYVARLTSMLGDLTASAQVTTRALSGSAALAVR